MTDPITVPALCLTNLQSLFVVRQRADREYGLALNSAIAALGLDPRGDHRFDIDTGILTPAAPKLELSQDEAK
jgi:hypothetical protein